MSSKSTVFLTKDNEHCYTDCNEPVTDESGKYIGDMLYLEIDAKNISSGTLEEDEDLTIGIKPGCELYDLLITLRQW